MKITKRHLVTVVVIIAIISAILVLERMKVRPPTVLQQSIVETVQPDVPEEVVNEFVKAKLGKYELAPELVGTQRWINSDPLTLDALKGKVVLVDFWTYTCINCIRTFPYLKEWDAKYSDKGLVIIGVHTPEFDFEKKYENVLNSVNKYELGYPIVQDNDYATWRAFKNRYWPRKYLIDMDGFIRYDHIGEGSYEKTEKVIQVLLKERMERLSQEEEINTSISKPEDAVDVSTFGVRTPEFFFGYQFFRGNFGNPEGLSPNQVVEYSLPSSIKRNNVYLQGAWKNNQDNMELVSEEGMIVLRYTARVVNIVAGSESGSTTYAFLDSEPLAAADRGSDVVLEQNNAVAQIQEPQLYNIVSAEDYGQHTVTINVKGKGFKIYTFTFG